MRSPDRPFFLLRLFDPSPKKRQVRLMSLRRTRPHLHPRHRSQDQAQKEGPEQAAAVPGAIRTERTGNVVY
jgi:hypothetical protein